MFRKRIKIGIGIKNTAVFCVLLMTFLITACGRNRMAPARRHLLIIHPGGKAQTSMR